jgi:hypothetical protein
LEYLRDEVFVTLGMALSGTEKREPGAMMEVVGLEREEISLDEIEHRLPDGSPELDTLRYIFVLYRIQAGRAKIYRTYWGRLELVAGMWHHVQEGMRVGETKEEGEPLWENWSGLQSEWWEG